MNQVLRSILNRFSDHLLKKLVAAERSSPATKAAIVSLYMQYQRFAASGSLPSYKAMGLRVFSEYEEDGILLLLLGAGGIKTKRFVDIGAGDCVTGSNTANLAVNLGFDGLFIDGDAQRIEAGRSFYQQHPDTAFYPPEFCHAMVKRETINDLLRGRGYTGEIDVLSIDIDGNDYWVWEALEAVSPRIVVVETHIEFGLRPIVVPYDPNYVYPGVHPDYHGASPVAMAKLARKLGYRLVAATRFGFNTFYLRNDLAAELVPEIPVEEVVSHRRSKERGQVFEAVASMPYIEV
jgi:hypothetical protein